MSDPILLSEGGPPKKKLRIFLQHFKDIPLLQIRYFYEDKEGNLQPTNKGVAIPRNRYLDLAESIQNHHDEIADFLAGERLDADALTTLIHLKANHSKKLSSVQSIAVSRKEGRKSELFEASFGGGEAQLVLNDNHDFVKKGANAGGEVSALAKALVAIELSAQLISDGESYEVQHTVDRLLNEFKRQLANLSDVIVSEDA